MRNEITEAMVEAAAIAIRTNGGCGLSLSRDGETVFCDHPELPDGIRDPECVCKSGARAALSAAPTQAAEQQEKPYDHAWRCDECGCHSYALAEERRHDGSFGPSGTKRCVNCKKTFAPPVACPEPEGWRFSACDGELLFEVLGKIVVSVESDGVGYTIFRDGKWHSGQHDVAEDIKSAGQEIAEALASLSARPSRQCGEERRLALEAAAGFAFNAARSGMTASQISDGIRDLIQKDKADE